jgi:hypothetical protein
VNRELNITPPPPKPAGLADVLPTAEDVGLVLREKRAALVEARAQIDVNTTGKQARAILSQSIAEIDHDLATMRGKADVVLCLATELGISATVVPVTEASKPGERL